MMLLDALAEWGPYAPVLIFLWFMAAYIVAGVRSRRYLTNRQRLVYFGSSVALLSTPVLMFLWSPWRNLDQHLLWWAISNAVFVVWPLILNQGLLSERKRWRAFGYARTTDVLLFRRPAELPMPEEATAAERRSNRSLYWALLATAAGLMVIGFFSVSLGPCEWLDIATGRSGCLRTWTVDGLAVNDVKFEPNGTALAVSGFDMPARVFRMTDGALLQEFNTGIGWYDSAVFSPDGKWLAVEGKTNTVTVWDYASGQLVRELSTRGSALQFSPDQKYLAVGYEFFVDKERESGIELWRISDWQIENTIHTESDEFAFAPNGQLLATVGTSGTIVLSQYDGTPIRSLAHNGFPTDMVFSPNADYLAIAPYVGLIEIWDVQAGKLLMDLPSDHPNQV
ncbi:MAG: hypothetical protein KA765_04595 [Thermoflexales bacterium]|nr:hypothetical protein [Thermoflexales bacterium]